MEKEMSIAEIIRGAEETRANGRRLAEERLVVIDAERAELKALLGRKRREPKATGAKKGRGKKPAVADAGHAHGDAA